MAKTFCLACLTCGGFGASEIGKAIGRSRQAVDSYIADLRAATQMELDVKIFRMSRLGIPQERIAKRLRILRTTLETHLTKMPELANSSKADLSRGSVRKVTELCPCKNRKAFRFHKN
jgi:biotin operon repressor